MHELIFEVVEEADGGYCASALGESIITEGDSLNELRENIREAVLCHFEGRDAPPQVIRFYQPEQPTLENENGTCSLNTSPVALPGLPDRLYCNTIAGVSIS